MPDSPARSRRGPINPRDTPNLRVQKPMGLPPMYEDLDDPRGTETGPPEYEDWPPGVRRPDPRGTRPQDPASWTRTKGFARPRTSWDPGLRGIRDFVGFKTSQDLGLCGIQDFAGHGTLWDLGLCRK